MCIFPEGVSPLRAGVTKTQRTGRLVTQPDTVLHLDRLEETGAKTEKPDTAWRGSGSCLPMEPEQDGGLGNCTKPYPEHHHHGSTAHPTRVRITAISLPQSKSTPSKLAIISPCLTNRPVRARG